MMHPAAPATSEKRLIALISFVFAATGVFQISRLIYDANTRSFFPVLPVFYFLLPLCLIAAAFLFWRRKKWGWILAQVYLVYLFLAGLASSTMAKFAGDILPKAHSSLGDSQPDYYMLPALFIALYYVGCSWFLNRRATRQIYGVNGYLAILCAVAGLVLFGLCGLAIISFSLLQ